jgi:hypothetical protein
MKQILLGLMLGLAIHCAGSEIVVLTKTPVAEFTLPDGSVLKNAYTWRRSSQGLMIMHDGGNYFLNFSLLPEAWKAVYLGAPPVAPATAVSEELAPPLQDKHKVASVLEAVPDLDVDARSLLLEKNNSEILDQDVLMLGVLQNLLSNQREEARRFFLIIEELQYELEAMDLDKLFNSCGNCGGDGTLNKSCKSCSESGKCPKCEGEGIRKSGLSKSTIDCTTCRGEGICVGCKGEGSLTPTCPKCRGAAKVIDQQYCEVKRDQIVRSVNAEASEGARGSLTSSATSGVNPVLPEWSELVSPALNFYLSEEYRGGMDTHILVGCILHSLLEERWEAAKRFELMVRVAYPDEEVLDIEKYLKPCKACEASGRIERACRSCEASGKCSQCEGSGERALEIGDDKIHCTTCRGTGKCAGCKGAGLSKPICQSCKGRGRNLDRQRAEVKLNLLVNEMNSYYETR